MAPEDCTQWLRNLVVLFKAFWLYFFSFLSTVIAQDTSGFWVHVWVSWMEKVWESLHQRRKKSRDMVSHCDVCHCESLRGCEEWRDGDFRCSVWCVKVGTRKSWHGYLHRSLATYPSFTTQLWTKRWVSLSWLSV